MQEPAADPPEPAMLDALKGLLQPGREVLSLESYLECVLYNPELGYYMRDRQRVGRNDRTDFYTAASLGAVFARLIVEAAVRLLEETPNRYTFVELGPESEGGILSRLPDHPFRDTVLIRPGETFTIPPHSIVFSNEVFDAQPFRRLVRTGDGWRESGLRIHRDRLEWDFLPGPAELPFKPENLPRGYMVDWPSGAHSLMERICRQPWQGLFLALDYGLDRTTVLTERPAGTARTYAGHAMGTDLLAQPGHRDITCHVIWDELAAIARQNGFPDPLLEHQEAFFMHHSAEAIRAIATEDPEGFSVNRQTLMELLHPANMGRKFQVLWALRREN